MEHCKKDSKEVDEQMSDYYWFAGSMSRETATAILINRKIGTYLLRIRLPDPSKPRETMYCLSLK